MARLLSLALALASPFLGGCLMIRGGGGATSLPRGREIVETALAERAAAAAGEEAPERELPTVRWISGFGLGLDFGVLHLGMSGVDDGASQSVRLEGGVVLLGPGIPDKAAKPRRHSLLLSLQAGAGDHKWETKDAVRHYALTEDLGGGLEHRYRIFYDVKDGDHVGIFTYVRLNWLKRRVYDYRTYSQTLSEALERDVWLPPAGGFERTKWHEGFELLLGLQFDAMGPGLFQALR